MTSPENAQIPPIIMVWIFPVLFLALLLVPLILTRETPTRLCTFPYNVKGPNHFFVHFILKPLVSLIIFLEEGKHELFKRTQETASSLFLGGQEFLSVFFILCPHHLRQGRSYSLINML